MLSQMLAWLDGKHMATYLHDKWRSISGRAPGVFIELEWVKAARRREPAIARELLENATRELLNRRFPERGRCLRHIVATSLSVQCENLGIPYDPGRINKLVSAVRLEVDDGGCVVVDIPDGWYEEVDRMFRVRTCAHCGVVLFPGLHPREECDAELVRSVMES